MLSCSEEKQNTLTGEVYYLQRIALTENAMVTISLVDITGKDIEVPILAQSMIKNPGQVPITFSIKFNPGNINSDHKYSLHARIEDSDGLVFVSDKEYQVINNEVFDSLRIQVVPVEQDERRKMQDERRETKEVKLNTPQEIDAQLSEMHKVTDNWAMGEASSTFYSFYFNDDLKFIIEQMNMGDYGSSEYKYYFKDGYLFYHEQNGKRKMMNPQNPNKTADVKVVMHFNGQGDLVGSSKTINYNVVELYETEAAGVLKHCELLVGIANSKYTSNLVE
jgi:putative lipoprotein